MKETNVLDNRLKSTLREIVLLTRAFFLHGKIKLLILRIESSMRAYVNNLGLLIYDVLQWLAIYRLLFDSKLLANILKAIN